MWTEFLLDMWEDKESVEDGNAVGGVLSVWIQSLRLRLTLLRGRWMPFRAGVEGIGFGMNSRFVHHVIWFIYRRQCCVV